MFRPRVIPVLLLKNDGLVKSVKFKNHRYIGDPINAVKIFNDLKADELVFLDILASSEKRVICESFVTRVGEEANMPFAVGGGIRTLDQIRRIINAGAEKVVINSEAVKRPEFIREAADAFGSSTIVACIDVKKSFFGKQKVWVSNGSKSVKRTPMEQAELMEKMGAGEIIIQSVTRDGTMEGYDVELLRKISERFTVPVIALGGAGTLQHMQEAYHQAYVTGLAAGSMFVYHGRRKAVLINYPEKEEIVNCLKK